MGENYQTQVCIVGSGPAGLILGYLLAKSGISVLVVEKNANFEREFRGEILQPRFFQLLDEIGLREYILVHHHLKIPKVEFFQNGQLISKLEFKKLISDVPYEVHMKQSVLLESILKKALEYPNFQIWFQTAVKDVIIQNKKVIGAKVRRKNEEIDVFASITVGADGRESVVQQKAGFQKQFFFHKNDMCWFKIKKPLNWENQAKLFFEEEHHYLILPRSDGYLQCGITMKKNKWNQIKKQGIDAYKTLLQKELPLFRESISEINGFESFSLLTAKIYGIKNWAKNGCLLIGDAAHCFGPGGAVGVSMSMETAIIASKVICESFEKNDFTNTQLCKVQKLRENEVKTIQKLQMYLEPMMMTDSKVIKKCRPFLFKIASITKIGRIIQKKLFIK